MDGREVGFGTAAFALEDAFEAGDRADHKADILAALALQDAGANRGSAWRRRTTPASAAMAMPDSVESRMSLISA